MNLLAIVIFLYSIPNIKGSHGLVFSESDILNIVKNLEDKIESQGKVIESQGKRMESQGKLLESQEKRIRLLEENCNNKEYGFLTVTDTMSRDEECPCDEIQTDIRFLKIENNRRQGEIELHDTRLNTVENDLNTVENDVAVHDTRLDTIENPVWFDAYRTSSFYTSDGYKTLNYTDARRASSYPNAMDINTGVFTAPETGTYQFIIQVEKYSGVSGRVKIVHEGTSISFIYDDDNSNGATITGTAIIPMEVGQRVWVETQEHLYSTSDVWIHFTGLLLTSK